MIKEFYQKVKNYDGESLEVINIPAFLNLGTHINIVLSGRETQGKTTTMLQFIREQYIKHNYRSVLIFNTLDKIRQSSSKLLSANRAIYPEEWDGVQVRLKGLFDKKNLNTPFCYFATINNFQSNKLGGRDPLVKYVFYDEFNEGLRGITQSQNIALENILMSANKNITLFLFGNRVSMDIPIFTDLEIGGIEKELDIKHYSKRLGKDRLEHYFTVLLYVPNMNKDTELKQHDIRLPKPNGNDWRHMLSYQFGLYGQSIENTKDSDNTDKVLNFVQMKEYTIPCKRPAYLVFGNITGEVFWNENNKTFLIKGMKSHEEISHKKLALTFDRSLLEPRKNIIYANNNIGTNWLKLFRQGRVFFSDMVMKNAFFSDIFGYA